MFKDSLHNGDQFTVTSQIKLDGRLKISFVQEIIRDSDNKIVTSAINTGVCLDIQRGKPIMPDYLRSTLGI